MPLSGSWQYRETLATHKRDIKYKFNSFVMKMSYIQSKILHSYFRWPLHSFSNGNNFDFRDLMFNSNDFIKYFHISAKRIMLPLNEDNFINYFLRSLISSCTFQDS